jgi:hypothetical protein
VRWFRFGNYVFLQQTVPTTLDVRAGQIIVQACEVLGSELLLLEIHDGHLWKDNTPNCTPCHLPYIGGTVHPGTSHIFAGLKCSLYGSTRCAAMMIICDICSTRRHLERSTLKWI